MPKIDYLELSGNVKANIDRFNMDYLRVNLNKTAVLKANINIDRIKAELNDGSKMELSGTGNQLDIYMGNVTRLNSFDFKVNDATIEARGTSTARISADKYLKIEARDDSSVRYKGDARVEIDRSNSAQVKNDKGYNPDWKGN